VVALVGRGGSAPSSITRLMKVAFGAQLAVVAVPSSPRWWRWSSIAAVVAVPALVTELVVVAVVAVVVLEARCWWRTELADGGGAAARWRGRGRDAQWSPSSRWGGGRRGPGRARDRGAQLAAVAVPSSPRWWCWSPIAAVVAVPALVTELVVVAVVVALVAGRGGGRGAGARSRWSPLAAVVAAELVVAARPGDRRDWRAGAGMMVRA
jgi:hypothetical protein